MKNNGWNTGISAALASALFLGLTPIFGKQALIAGFSPLAVVTLRTGMATTLLIVVMAVFRRGFFYIYPVGLVGCVLAGFLNGLGSILYYTALNRLDASIAHLIYSFYPLFVALLQHMDSQPINRLTFFRVDPFCTRCVPAGERRPTECRLVGRGVNAGISYALCAAPVGKPESIVRSSCTHRYPLHPACHDPDSLICICRF